MSIPSELKYTPSHEWVRAEADGTVTVGITHHAQDLLGDMVFVENPTVGRKLAANEECANHTKNKRRAGNFLDGSDLLKVVLS